jgi:hypothetical protein
VRILNCICRRVPVGGVRQSHTGTSNLYPPHVAETTNALKIARNNVNRYACSEIAELRSI